METIRKILHDRVVRFEVFQMAGPTTPRFAAQLESTINIYRETAKLDSADIRETTNNIEALMDDLMEHWAKVFPSFDEAAMFYRRMSAYRYFLQEKLREDYLKKKPHIVSQEIVWLARSQGEPADRERAVEMFKMRPDKLDEHYQKRVSLVLHEMMVDSAHVEQKFRAAAARDGRPGSDIQPLIDNCQWPELAGMLVKDRVLTVQMPGSILFDEKMKRNILRGIDRVQKRYFDSITSPSIFVISARAGALSARPAAGKMGTPLPGNPSHDSDPVDDEESSEDEVTKQKQESNSGS
jgi:hypothetical protein